MTKRGYVRPATIDDAKYLAPRLREADREECLAVVGKTPEAFLPGSVALAQSAYTIISPSGDRIGIFGCTKTSREGVGAVWLLATDGLPKHATQFLRESRGWVAKMHEHFPTLWNIVDTRNPVHLKWISWCGFKFHGLHFIGPQRLPFLEFSKVK